MISSKLPPTTSTWRDATGKTIDAPAGVHAVRIHKMMGGTVDVWQDNRGLTVNDPLLPKAVAGLTATFVDGGWILGGQTEDGGRPRDLGFTTT
jgi:hypothetical protein